MTVFVPNMTVLVPTMTVFVPNMTVLVINMTIFNRPGVAGTVLQNNRTLKRIAV